MKYEELAEKYEDFYPPPNCQIAVDGEDILKKYLIQIINVSFEDAIDASDRFSFTINDPELDWLDSDLFEPGKIVEIKMGYLDRLLTMIIGEIVSIKPSFPSNSTPQIEISGYDLSYQFSRVRKNRSWKNQKDSDVVAIVANEAKHKLKNHIEPTETVFPKIIQDGETDFKFIKNLADRNFFNFYVKGKDFHFCKPKKKQESTTLEYGKSLLSFSPELNIANQVSEVIVGGWNPKTSQKIVGKAKIRAKKEGQSGGEMIKNIFGKVEQRITDTPVYSQQEANALARSILWKLSVGLVRGRAECIGIPEIRAGDTVVLKGLGKKFSRKYFIEKTTHSISSSRYSTMFDVRGDIV